MDKIKRQKNIFQKNKNKTKKKKEEEEKEINNIEISSLLDKELKNNDHKDAHQPRGMNEQVRTSTKI